MELILIQMNVDNKAIAAAKIKEEHTESDMLPVFVLTLVDTNSETDIHISDDLVDKRLAEVDPTDAVEISDPSSIALLSFSPSIPFPQAASNPHVSAKESARMDVPPLPYSQALTSGQECFIKSHSASNLCCSETIGSITVQNEEFRRSMPDPLIRLTLYNKLL